MISVYVTSPFTSSERKVSPEWSLGVFKAKMEAVTGIPSSAQTLTLYPYSNDDTHTTLPLNDQATLASFELREYMRIHISDTRPESEWNDFEAATEQEVADAAFVLKEEDYEKKSATVLQWKKDQKLGRFNPEFEARKAHAALLNQARAETMAVGMRCRITPSTPMEAERRGCVRYLGRIAEIDDGEGVWVGVELDEPTGKNDGSVKGARYFTCGPHYGSFVKPVLVEVGDFPPQSLWSDDEL